MSDGQAIADRIEIEAPRGEFADAVMMRGHDRVASLVHPGRRGADPRHQRRGCQPGADPGRGRAAAPLTTVPAVFMIRASASRCPRCGMTYSARTRGARGERALPAVVGPPYVGVMKRLVGRAVGSYLLFAIIGRFVEGMGAVECSCSSDCWCRRPVLSTFRWVFPFGHRSP
jgi:hypothetical protein